MNLASVTGLGPASQGNVIQGGPSRSLAHACPIAAGGQNRKENQHRGDRNPGRRYIEVAMGKTFVALKRWARRWGLAGLGYAQDDFHGHHQLLWVWRPFRAPRFEVWRWPVGFGSSDLARWMKPLPLGSSEAYHRIEFSAERVYAGQDFEAAREAMVGRYPPEIAAMERIRLPGDPRVKLD